jgi:hypothetical protein
MYNNVLCMYLGMYISDFLKVLFAKETFNKLNICTNQNETLMK